MKILHTADWHLGKWLDDYSRLPEQKEILEEICEIAERELADVVVIAGDLFDTFNPSAEAQDLFYKTLRRLGNNGKRVVVAIAGNHDQPDRIQAPDHLARECGIIFIGYPNSKIPICSNQGGLTITNSEEGFLELKLQKCDVALADNIQHLTRSKQNFFFLDEGFGSLDKEALAIVFGTLKNLRLENRIVGVISHVEEMQQEIPVNLQIRNDADSGSYIKNSWD